MKYRGSCHCGKVALEVEGEIAGAMACNCSICTRMGSLLWFVPRDQMKLLTDENDVASYKFNKHVIDHHFCKSCGMHPYADGSDGKGNKMAAINLRCIEDLDLEKIPVKHFNGRAL
jgi:hypothetical protein